MADLIKLILEIYYDLLVQARGKPMPDLILSSGSAALRSPILAPRSSRRRVSMAKDHLIGFCSCNRTKRPLTDYSRSRTRCPHCVRLVILPAGGGES